MADITITRTYDCAVAELWAAWTDIDQYREWIAADPWKPGPASMDVREGGAYDIVTIAPDGSEFTFSGVYTDVVPCGRLMSRGDLRGPDGSYIFKDAGLTITMREVEPGVTEQTLVNTDLVPDELAAQIEVGWETGGLMDLERFLASRKANA